MSRGVFTLHEQLEEIERLIEAEKDKGGVADNISLAIQRSIASDIRARINHDGSVTKSALEQRLHFMRRSKTPLGYSPVFLWHIPNKKVLEWRNRVHESSSLNVSLSHCSFRGFLAVQAVSASKELLIS